MAACTSIVATIIPLANRRMAYGTATLAGATSTLITGLQTIYAHGVQIVGTALTVIGTDVSQINSNHTETEGTITMYPSEETATSAVTVVAAPGTTPISWWAIGS